MDDQEDEDVPRMVGPRVRGISIDGAGHLGESNAPAGPRISPLWAPGHPMSG